MVCTTSDVGVACTISAVVVFACTKLVALVKSDPMKAEDTEVSIEPLVPGDDTVYERP